MNPGDLRHRVMVQVLTESYDSGELTNSWADAKPRWAQIIEGEGRELHRAQQIDAQLTHIVWMYYYDGLSPKDNRLTYDGRTLNIRGISNPDGRKAYHRLTCVEDLG